MTFELQFSCSMAEHERNECARLDWMQFLSIAKQSENHMHVCNHLKCFYSNRFWEQWPIPISSIQRNSWCNVLWLSCSHSRSIPFPICAQLPTITIIMKRIYEISSNYMVVSIYSKMLYLFHPANGEKSTKIILISLIYTSRLWWNRAPLKSHNKNYKRILIWYVRFLFLPSIVVLFHNTFFISDILHLVLPDCCCGCCCCSNLGTQMMTIVMIIGHMLCEWWSEPVDKWFGEKKKAEENVKWMSRNGEANVKKLPSYSLDSRTEKENGAEIKSV